MTTLAPQTRRKPLAPPLVAIAGWLVPGSGYWLLGQKKRAMIVGISVVALYLLGLLFAGSRVVEVPGWDSRTGVPVRIDARGRRLTDPNDPAYPGASFSLTGRGLLGEIVNKPWFVGQVLAGPISLISAAVSVNLGQDGIPTPKGRLAEIGTLYTAVAGMLNLLAIIDSAHRAGEEG